MPNATMRPCCREESACGLQGQDRKRREPPYVAVVVGPRRLWGGCPSFGFVGLVRLVGTNPGGFDAGGPTRSPADEAVTSSTVPGQVAALLLALAWGTVGFGIIDLDTAIPPADPEFRGHWFLEGSNGLYVTALVMVPLLVVVLAPGQQRGVCRQLHVLAGCSASAALLCLDGSLLLLPFGFEMTVLLVWLPLRASTDGAPERVRWRALVAVVGTFAATALAFGPDAFTGRLLGILAGTLGLAIWLAWTAAASATLGPFVRGRWPLLLTGLAGAFLWSTYAVRMASDFWSGMRYAGTVDRISSQSGLALALAALPLGVAVGWLTVRLTTWTAAAASAGIGWFGVLNPGEVASIGVGWGLGVLAWSFALLVVSEATLHRRSRAA